jgi:membrane fusion protein (multidrug efflux system)
MHSSSRRHLTPRLAAKASLLLALALGLSSCSKAPQAGAAAPQALEVNVLTVAPEAVSLATELPGRVTPLRVSEVRARISGIVLKRCFTEGSDVKEGDLLFEIDPAPYEAALDSARASLARAKASSASSSALAERYKGLVDSNAISRQAYDDAVAAALAGQADLLAASAAVRNAEINLSYTRVTSPITGRIGRASVTEGAYVQQGSATLLATVQQLDPLYIDLSQSAEDVLKLKQALESGRLQQVSEGKAKLTVTLADGRDYPQTGYLQFSEIAVNASTGTVTLRGVVPNPNLNLLPGMFVRARVEEGRNPAALLIPQSVLRRNSKGQGTVLVVGADSKVEMRIVETSSTVGNRWVVSSGIKAGDQVILDNLQKLRPGVPVRIAAPSPTQAPAAPAAR